jgi:hypothetical protein
MYHVISGQRNLKQVSSLQGFEDMHLGNTGQKRNLALLLRAMDNEIFSGFRNHLDSSDTDQYMVIDFRTL